MRSVSFKYLKQTYNLIRNSGITLSGKRLRRCAYLDVHQNNYKLFQLYNNYKKVVNSDAANNQIIALIIVVGAISIALLFILTSL